MAGEVKGYFPSFINKTDQERCQNLGRQIFSDLDAKYEVTVKLDGASMTVYHDPDGTGGVCSRNLELNVAAIENEGNTLVKLAKTSGLLEVIRDHFPSFAFQGELMGNGIQGNRENLRVHKFFIFDIFSIETGTYLSPDDRREVYNQLSAILFAKFGVVTQISHVPVLYQSVSLRELGFEEIPEAIPSHGVVRDENGKVVGAYAGGEDQRPYEAVQRNLVKLLEMAEGKSLVHDIREGVVFKRVDGKFSFKAVSNKYLIKLKD